MLILTCPKCGAKTPFEDNAIKSFVCNACNSENNADCLICAFSKEKECTDHPAFK